MLRGHEGGPLVIGSTMYVHTPFPNIVYALDLAKEGAPIKWKYTPKQDPQVVPVACCDTVNRGLAYADGKIFQNQLDSTTVALDAETGKEVWKVKQGDFKNGQTVTAAPIVIKDKVISGISGGEFGVRGFVTANDVKTGKQIWRMYSTGPEAEVGFPGSVETWKGDEWKTGRRHDVGLVQLRSRAQPLLLRHRQPRVLESRSAAWRQQVVDDDLRARSRHRQGEVGLPEDAARPRGTTTASTRTSWSILNVHGQMRKVLVNFDRNGFAYTLDRATGELLMAEPFVNVNWATQHRPEDRPADRGSREADVRDEEHQGHLSVGDGRKEPAAGRLLAEDVAASTCRPTICAWTTKASR